MVTGVSTVTVLLVEMAKFALVLPCGTVTLLPTVARLVLPLASVIGRPFWGAGKFRVTVPVEATPPGTAAGLIVTPAIQFLILRVAVCTMPPSDAVIVVEAGDLRALALMTKVAPCCPAGTVTEGATVAAAGLLLA